MPGVDAARERRERLGREDVPVTRRTERVLEPAQLGGDARDRRLPEREPGEPEARPQPPQTHAELVQILGILADEQPVFVRLHLRNAPESDSPQRRAGRERPVERRRTRLLRHGGRAAGERVAALGLARVPEADRHVASDLARKREQAVRVAGLQLDLGLADRRRALARADLPAVDRELGGGAVRERDHPRRAVELGGEHRLEPLADALAREQPPVRRLVEHREIGGPVPGERPLELLARVQAGRGDAFGLERLDAVLAAPAHPQRDALPREREVGRVVVHGGEVLPPRRPAPHPLQRRVPLDTREVMRRDQQLQLDFHASSYEARGRGKGGGTLPFPPIRLALPEATKTAAFGTGFPANAAQRRRRPSPRRSAPAPAADGRGSPPRP